MSTEFENLCFRCRTDCVPISNISSYESPESFICIGYNKPEDRSVKGDRFTFCWKNNAFDERSYYDKRDLIDTMSVIAQALSIDQNIMTTDGLTEEDMQSADMVST